MKFVHFTDLHLVAPAERLWGFDPLLRFEHCLADIVTNHRDAQFCVITGDLAERGELSAYTALKDRLAAFPLPCHLLIGNHDDRKNFRRVFGDVRCDGNGFVQSSITVEGHKLLFIDTVKDGASSAGVYSEQRQQWLARELAQTGDMPVLLFMHHPPFSIGHALMDSIKLEQPEKFEVILAGYDIRHIFFGHAHRAVSGMWRGISFSGLPSLVHQLPLTAGSVPTVYSDEPAMYSVVHVEDDRTIVHMDAFLNRGPAEMAYEAERDNWY